VYLLLDDPIAGPERKSASRHRQNCMEEKLVCCLKDVGDANPIIAHDKYDVSIVD
jgi:hypothetical protein